ncbi:MAG: rod shape-determining protein MreD [Candidatus Marinimicrobia bacterium]|nr:rod shape-determining protein MreD [Candidatus Neomarinimicrobiota bacterium]MBT3828179.1 rod shape-determining protein MreD [Candidatus Neomarinimicrobiota bacterium]MBT4280562.1 rod shape-determining protein MreD [Candidatus Neomarinimicrobiota bacterium]MBT4568955.1 rod shape-determining protein MreD [Candidatus Neomarinimicrobiota bacterium]MBT4795423.1 rod shape-determining protein MreD [Candidatus Neomarinimicrobiota bacterium]
MLQFFFAEVMSINAIRPDFIMILVLYIGVTHGRFAGVIAGFIAGFLVDLAGVGSFFGLTSLTCSITGYLAGFLHGRYRSWIPMYFHAGWVSIVFIHFLIFSFVRFQYTFNTNPGIFFLNWIFSVGYTLGFLIVLQFMIPFAKVCDAEN